MSFLLEKKHKVETEGMRQIQIGIRNMTTVKVCVYKHLYEK